VPAHGDETAFPHDQLRALLDLPFTNVLPVHGTPVLGGATKHFKPAVERATSR
jgi:hypothetical protein